MQKLIKLWRWWLPFLLWSADAHACGLYTHVYFAQLLLWAIPISDVRFRKAATAHPRLVLAGACLPDLSLVGRYHAAPALGETHRWEAALHQLAAADGDAECALALGYVSHLLSDVIAHNHFVPAHEELWGNVPMLTHACAEWAMDKHIQPHLFVTPAELLDQHRHELSVYAARHLECGRREAWRSLHTLARAESLLRNSRLHEACYRGGAWRDERLRQRFNHYLRETGGRLVQINQLLAGKAPQWQAEPCGQTTRERIGRCAAHQIRGRLPLPQNLFA